jgi:hypothetical protein
MLVRGKFSPSAAYVSGSTARHVFQGAAVMYVLLSAPIIIYFKEYSDTEQSLIYSYEQLVETICNAVTLKGSMMAEVLTYLLIELSPS